jgi:hypothetical protein
LGTIRKEEVMNYIFLDIDGVMNNQTDWLNKAKNNTERFENHRMFCDHAWSLLALVCGVTDAQIILSSSWRSGFTQTNDGVVIREDLNCSLTSRLMDYFERYDIPLVGLTTKQYFQRGKQIMDYVNNHFTINDNWVVLDDEVYDMELIPQDKMIKTEWKTGLQYEHIERIIKYFKGE